MTFCDIQPACLRGRSLRPGWHMMDLCHCCGFHGTLVTCRATGCTLRSAILKRGPREKPRGRTVGTCQGRMAAAQSEESLGWSDFIQASTSTREKQLGPFGVLWKPCDLGKRRVSRRIQMYKPRALRFPGELRVWVREPSSNASDHLLRVLWSPWPGSPGVAVYWKSMAIQQVVGDLVTWTRKESGAGLQFCFIHIQGFSTTTMRTFSFLCWDRSMSRMQKSWMPRGVDSGLRPKAGWGVRSEERVSPESQRPPLPLLPPLLPPLLSPSTPSGGSPTPPSPAWGEGEEHPPWVSWLSSAHHLKVQQALFHTKRNSCGWGGGAHCLLPGLLAGNAHLHQTAGKAAAPDNSFLSPLVPFSQFSIQSSSRCD